MGAKARVEPGPPRPRAWAFTTPTAVSELLPRDHFYFEKKKTQNTKLQIVAIVSACPKLQTTSLAAGREFHLVKGEGAHGRGWR